MSCPTPSEADTAYTNLTTSLSRFSHVANEYIHIDDPFERKKYFEAFNKLTDSVNQALAVLRKVK